VVDPVVITDSFYPLRAKVSFDFNPIASVWLPFAMQDEALLSTIMLSSAIQAKNLNPEAYSQTTRHLFTSAIRTIDRRLSSSMLTDATIGAVSCLVLIELALDQHEKSAVHGSGLVEMIRLRGGIGSINRSLQMKIYRYVPLLPRKSFVGST
jgi:Fungal specific transcription factor domain